MFPVTITLHNAADLGKVMAALSAPIPSPEPAPQPAPVASPAPAPKPKAEKTASPAPSPAPASTPSAPTVATAGSDAPATPAGDPPSTADAPAVKYDDLKAAVFKLAGKSRDAAVAINKAFGVATMKELAADRWADALAAVNAKLAELEG